MGYSSCFLLLERYFTRPLYIHNIRFAKIHYSLLTLGEGYLAYGTSHGSVGLVKITQKLEEKVEFSFSPQYTVQTTYDIASSLIYGSERKSGITAMRWIQIPGRSVSFYPIIIIYINFLFAGDSSSLPPRTHKVLVRYRRRKWSSTLLDRYPLTAATNTKNMR